MTKKEFKQFKKELSAFITEVDWWYMSREDFYKDLTREIGEICYDYWYDTNWFSFIDWDSTSIYAVWEYCDVIVEKNFNKKKSIQWLKESIYKALKEIMVEEELNIDIEEEELDELILAIQNMMEETDELLNHIFTRKLEILRKKLDI